jgi:hypothetical protein
MEEGATENQLREGWEPEFEEITRREIERLAVPTGGQGRDG